MQKEESVKRLIRTIREAILLILSNSSSNNVRAFHQRPMAQVFRRANKLIVKIECVRSAGETNSSKRTVITSVY